MQLLFGAYLDPPMWFLVDLIILSILFYSIFWLLRDAERGILAIVIVTGVAIYAQYSGLNYKIFGNLPYYSKWTLGRLAELVPLASLGIVLSHYKIMDKLFQHRKAALTISIIGLFLFYHTSLFYPVLDGFYYQGMPFIWLSVCLTVFFWCFPLEWLPVKIRMFFNKWSRYNMGIIAMHYMVKTFFDVIVGEVRRLSLLESLMVYVVSLLISVAAVHIPVKFIRNSFI